MGFIHAESWRMYRRGDHVSDKEMKKMYDQLKAAMPYLMDRLPETFLAYQDAVNQINALRSYLITRKVSFKEWTP